jgi:hypothetical protein
MHRLRQIALVILLAGWMLPAVAAQKAHEQAPKKVVEKRNVVEFMTGGSEAPPTPAERVVSLLRTIAGRWFVIALIYAGVLTIRFRRTLVT